MKLSFLTYLARRLPLEASFRMAAENGLDGVEIWGARPHAYAYDLDAAAVSEIRGLRSEYGVEISMFTPELLAYPYNLSSKNEKERRETVSYLKASAEAAAAIGAPLLQVTCGHPGVFEREADWARLVEGLGEVARAAERAGVDVVIEPLTPMESPIVVYADDVRRLIRDVGSPRMKGMIDVCVPAAAHEPPSAYFDTLGPDLVYVHVSDGDGATDAHIRPGFGDLPLEAFFRTLRRRGYDGWVSLELLTPYFKDPEAYLCEAAETIRKIMS